MMQYSEAARQRLTEKCEGFRDRVYLDPVGVPTGGYGHTEGLTQHDVGMEVPEELADQWLAGDVATAESAVNGYVEVTLTQDQFDALVDFTFNEGVGNFAHSTLLRKVNAGDMAGADEEFARWVRAGNERLPGLVTRRAMEAHWFDDGATS